MLYWIPRISLVILICLVAVIGLVPLTTVGIAASLGVIALGLGLFSIMLRVFPPERY